MTAHARFARWRRPTIAAVLLLLDQATKTIAQFALDGSRIELATDWGLTYTVNAGTWLWPDISGRMLIVAHGIGILVWIGWLTATAWYRRSYRTSVTVDLATGFFTCAVFGNVLDRLFVGGARDWVITPIATGNLADVAIWPAIALLFWELWLHPPARRLLSWRPSNWHPPQRSLPANPAGPRDLGHSGATTNNSSSNNDLPAGAHTRPYPSASMTPPP